MVTEFGQPTSLGCAHLAPLGRNQGCHSEQEAATNVVDMLHDLRDEGLAGGVVFMWLDEWFKFTWNTIDYELPHHNRALWRNVFTNEEHFGIIAAEPGPRDLVVLDGHDDEWATVASIGHGTRSIGDVAATSDAENVYLRLKVSPDLWRHKRIVIGLDARPGGNRGLPDLPGVDPGAEMAVVIEPGGEARMYHAGWIETLGLRYGINKGYIPTNRADVLPESGTWVRLRQILNYPYRLPESGRMNPTELRDASLMPWGTTDPASPAFDDRHLVMGRDGVLEIALPWGMLSVADPSSHRLYVVGLDGKVTTRKADALGIAIAVDGEPLVKTTGYRWEGWDTVQWHERRKAGWPILQRAFQGYRGVARRKHTGRRRLGLRSAGAAAAARMRPVEVLAQVRGRHVRVDLRGDRARVAQMGLDVADVDARLDQVRAARMAQRVREDPLTVLQQPGGLRHLLHRLPHRRPAHPPAAGREEHRVGVAVARLVGPRAPIGRAELRPADGQVREERGAGHRRHGHRALPGPLAVHDHVGVVRVVQMAVRQVERRRLARPQPESVECLDEGMGPCPQRAGQPGGRLAHGPHLRLVERDDLAPEAPVRVGHAAGRPEVAHRALQGEEPRPPLAERTDRRDPSSTARRRSGEPVSPSLPPAGRDRRQRLRRAPRLGIVLDAEHGDRTAAGRRGPGPRRAARGHAGTPAGCWCSPGSRGSPRRAPSIPAPRRSSARVAAASARCIAFVVTPV